MGEGREKGGKEEGRVRRGNDVCTYQHLIMSAQTKKREKKRNIQAKRTKGQSD